MNKIWSSTPADANSTPLSLALSKSRMIYLHGSGLPRLSWKRGQFVVVIEYITDGSQKVKLVSIKTRKLCYCKDDHMMR